MSIYIHSILERRACYAGELEYAGHGKKGEMESRASQCTKEVDIGYYSKARSKCMIIRRLNAHAVQSPPSKNHRSVFSRKTATI
jgi:hypothetical protein